MLMAQEHPLDSLLADTRLYHRTGKLDDFTEAHNVLAIRYIEHYSEMLKIVSVLEAIAADFLSYETHELKNLFIMVKQFYDVVTWESSIKLFQVTNLQNVAKFLRRNMMLPENITEDDRVRFGFQEDLQYHYQEVMTLRGELKPYLEKIQRALILNSKNN